MLKTIRLLYFALPGLMLSCGAVALSAMDEGGAIVLAQQTVRHGPVSANETLWSIARRYAPDNASVSRMSVSIFRANPSAFYDNNINRLRQGAILTIPTVPAALSAVDRREAVQVLQSHETTYRAFYEDYTATPSSSSRDPAPDLEAVAALGSVLASNDAPAAVQTPVAEAEIEAVQDVTQPGPILTAANSESAPTAGSSPAPAVSTHAEHEEVETRLSYDVSAIYDDNIRKSRYPSDIRDDYLVNLTLHGRMIFSVSEFSNMTLGARFGIEKFSTFDKLDSALIEANMKYSFAFSSSFSAPTYSLKLQLGTQDFESDMRDADFAGIGFEVGSQLTDRLFLIGGVKAKTRESRSQVFDTTENQVFINVDLNLSRRTLMYLTYSLLNGDLVSTATPRLVFINAAEVIEPDDAYGGVAFDQFAYRLDATTQVVTLGYNHALRRGLTFDLSLRYVSSEADNEPNIHYDRTIVRGGFIGRF
jgi:FimV-like protein